MKTPTPPQDEAAVEARARELPIEIAPVDQTVVGIGNDRANCFQACLAMISGLALADCIDITDPTIEYMWVDAVSEWAAQYGWAFKSGIRPPTDRPCIANGPTADRKGVHGVVCAGGNLFHDPHPSRSGIVSVNWYGWLEPLSRPTDPSAVPAGGVNIVARLQSPIVADYDENYLVARVNKGGTQVGIDHPCDAVWSEVMAAHVALRDYINERIERQDSCPFKAKAAHQQPARVEMLLFCPKCGEKHIDAPDERTPDWTNPPHKSHLCHGCGTIWRPADVPTEGVAAIVTSGKADTIDLNALASLRPSPIPPQGEDALAVEAIAKLIYDGAMLHPALQAVECDDEGKPVSRTPWVERGNSDIQEDCRRIARSVKAALARAGQDYQRGLREALELAANRLDRCAVEIATESSARKYEWAEWAIAARTGHHQEG